ncbi:MAG: hypothetical protein MUE88_09605 [Flavobacteriales bacterium]|nr:hypothetical protein [Flavobacteriales bacterium]
MNRRPSILAVAATLLLSSTTVACLAQAGDDKVKVRVRISTDDDAKAKLRPISMVRESCDDAAQW